MTIRFPDQDYPDVIVEYDTEMGQGIYCQHGDRITSPLNKSDWEARLREWRIDLYPEELRMDVGL